MAPIEALFKILYGLGFYLSLTLCLGLYNYIILASRKKTEAREMAQKRSAITEQSKEPSSNSQNIHKYLSIVSTVNGTGQFELYTV